MAQLLQKAPKDGMMLKSLVFQLAENMHNSGKIALHTCARKNKHSTLLTCSFNCFLKLEVLDTIMLVISPFTLSLILMGVAPDRILCKVSSPMHRCHTKHIYSHLLFFIYFFFQALEKSQRIKRTNIVFFAYLLHLKFLIKKYFWGGMCVTACMWRPEGTCKSYWYLLTMWVPGI